MFIKSSKLKFVFIALLALVAIQLITAYIFAFIAQKQLNLQFERLSNSPMVKVIKHESHRGLFGVEEISEISLNNVLLSNILSVIPSEKNNDSMNKLAQHAEKYSIKYTTHVSTGLFSGLLKGNFLPIIAYADIKINYSESLKKLLDKFFDSKTPLSIVNVIYLNKSGKYHFVSSKFNYEETVSGVKVVWGGLDLSIDYNAKFTDFDNQLLVPKFWLVAPTKLEILLDNLSYNSSAKYSSNNIKVGNSSMSINALNVSLKDKVPLDFKIGDILGSLTGLSGVQFLNGIDAINPSNFSLSHLTYVTKSQDENNYFGANARIKFKSLITNSKSYGPMDLDIAVNHILSEPFSKMLDKISDLSAMNNESENKKDSQGKITNDGLDANKANEDDDLLEVQNPLITTIREYAGPILINNPEIHLNKFSLKTPEGLIYISGYAKTNNFTLQDINSQEAFMRKILVDVKFSIPKSVLSYILMLQMRYLLSAGNAEMDAQSTEAFGSVVNILLDNQVNTWSKKGYIKNNHNILESHVLLKDGKLFLNGLQSK